MDCNNLQNSYVLRILFVLCFWGEGDWLGAGEEGGGGGYETFHLLWGGYQIFSDAFRGMPNFMVVFWNTLHPPPQYTYFMTGPPKTW
jgi:hypothetical protein